MRVSCYRNLNRKGVVWSVKSDKTSLVVARSRYVVLKEVTFRVSEAGRLRVVRDMRKNVHAYVSGTRITRKEALKIRSMFIWVRVQYNPYNNRSFVTAAGKKVIWADYVILDENGAWAANPQEGV